MKKGQDQVNRDGKTWFWSPHHKMKGKYDGLYVTHKPEEHEEWVRKKNERNARKKKTRDEQKETDQISQNDVNGSKLTISNSLKAALMTHMDILPEQVDAIFREAENSADF